jgi:Trk K+ transport system NAD-binding subunit
VNAPPTKSSYTLLHRAWRWASWRGIPLIFTFACGLSAFMMGVGASDRPGIAAAGILTKVYYTIGLFVLGGMDLGIPVGGTSFGRGLMWFAYFAAPAITTSAVIEGLIKAIRRETLLLGRLRGHIVIGGCGRLTLLCLRRIRETLPHHPVVIIELRPDCPHVEEARDAYGARVVVGDITSAAMLDTLRIERAERVFLLTGSDFANLDAATNMLSIAPRLGARTVVHVGDLGFMRAMGGTRVARDCVPFNTHQVAAQHVVETKLQAHFRDTEALDTVVIAGFGRFGQTVLDELQLVAPGKFDKVVIVDLNAQRSANAFDEEVGFRKDYERVVIDGDLRDVGTWTKIHAHLAVDEVAPAFILGSGHDATNLHTALRLRKRYPQSLVVARTFTHSSFADEVARDAGFSMLSVGDLLLESMPDDWFAPRSPAQAPAPFSRSATSVTLSADGAPSRRS